MKARGSWLYLEEHLQHKENTDGLEVVGCEASKVLLYILKTRRGSQLRAARK